MGTKNPKRESLKQSIIEYANSKEGKEKLQAIRESAKKITQLFRDARTKFHREFIKYC